MKIIPDFEEDPIGWVLLIIGIAIVAVVILSTCTSTPTCVDNPRNMRCMTPSQLEQELAK